jgi:hypothetical protein
MLKEFIPYELAIALKELGFDETCFMSYNPNPNWWDNYCTNSEISSLNGGSNIVCSAPLYQQAFRWFREKYNLFGYSYPNDYQMYGYRIVELKSSENKELIYDWGTLNTHEEAELECLKKLIEIVKEK